MTVFDDADDETAATALLQFGELGNVHQREGMQMTDNPFRQRLAAGWTVTLLLFTSCGLASPPAADPPKAIKTRDDLVALFGTSKGFGPVQRAEFCQSGRQVLCVWYDPFSGRSACYLHAYYYNPEKREWILFINRILEGPGDLSAEMTWESLLFRDTRGAVVLKESVSKLPTEKWHSDRGSDAPLPLTGLAAGGTGGKVLKTRDEVKALFPEADSWLETEYGGRTVMFCAKPVPSYGSSRIDIHGWILRRHSNEWEVFLSVRANGVGQVMLSVDPKSGLFSAKGIANNKFRKRAVFTFDLNATEI